MCLPRLAPLDICFPTAVRLPATRLQAGSHFPSWAVRIGYARCKIEKNADVLRLIPFSPRSTLKSSSIHGVPAHSQPPIIPIESGLVITEQSVLALGASHVSVAQFSFGRGDGLVLNRAMRRTVDSDPEKRDGWLSAVRDELNEMRSRFPLESVRGLVLPEWVVLTKHLRVTRIEGEGQREVVRFEADQAFPNGLEGFQWAYGVLHDDGVERDVLVHVVESDFLDNLLEMLRSFGIQPRFIDAFVSAHLNAYAYNYGGDRTRTLLIDIGARSVSLSVAGGSEAPFLRSLSFGGGQITQALATELGQSFEEAEKLKIQWLDNPAVDPAHLAHLNRASEGFTRRMLNEVQRSLALYRRHYQAGNPARVLLSGMACRLPQLANRLERKTGIPVILYDPFRNLSFGDEFVSGRAPKWAPSLPGRVGVAARLIGASPIDINLLPESHSSGLAFSEKKPWLKAAAGLFLGAGVLIGLKFQGQTWNLQREIEQAGLQVGTMEASARDVRAAYEKFNALKSRDVGQAELRYERIWHVLLLAELQGRLNLVRNVWLESFRAVSDDAGDRQLRITGSLLDRQNPLSVVSSDSRRQVESLLTSFEGLPFIAKVGDRRFDTSRPGILKFDVSLTLEPEMPF